MGIGEIPDWLDEHAREEWARVAPELLAAGVVSRVEAAALGCYCQAVSRLRAAEAEIARDGITIETKQGATMRNPNLNTARDAMMLIRQFAAEFGMTPASRSKVRATSQAAAPANEFAAM